MFIRFLKSNSASALVFLPLFAIAIWGFGFISPAIVSVKHTMPLYELCTRALQSTPSLGTIIAFLLIIGEAFLLNYIVNENEVLSKQSYLPALFYVLFISNNNDMLLLSPPLFANLFILFAINKLLTSYRKDNAFSQAFDAGMLISVATLFYFPYIVFLPLLGVGLIIMRPFNWREWLISFFGAVIPYIFVLTYYFWKDQLDYLFFDKMFYPFVHVKTTQPFPKSFYFMIGTGWLILLCSLGKLIQGVGIGSQKTKKSIILLVWFFLFSAISVLIAPEISTKYFVPLVIPAALFW